MHNMAAVNDHEYIYITIIGVAYSFLGGAGSSGTTVSPVVGLLSIGTPPSVWSVDDHTLSWNDGKQGNRTMVDSYVILQMPSNRFAE